MNLEDLGYLYIVATVIVSFFVLNDKNRFIVHLFCFGALFFGMIGKLIPGLYGSFYYWGAAITDLIIIWILSRLAKPNKLTIKMIAFCLSFMALNSFGWYIFMDGSTPEPYDFLCTTLYALILISIITGKNNHVGNVRVDFGDPNLCISDNPSGYVFNQNKKEARN